MTGHPGATLAGETKKDTDYQEKRLDYPVETFGHPLIRFEIKGESPRTSYLRFVPTPDGTQPRFDTQPITVGKELAIRGYWISKGLLDAYRTRLGRSGFARGPGAPGYDEILKSFRGSDAKSFTEIVARLDELRREPVNADEAIQARDALDPKRKSAPEDYFDRSVIGTGMIEVEDPAQAGSSDGNRRFVPLTAVLNGQLSIDPERARVKVLRSVAMMVISDSLLQDHERAEAAISRAFEAMECRSSPSPCAKDGAVFTQGLDILLKAATTDNGTRFNVMDPKYDQKIERAEQEKLNKILRELKALCGA